MEIEKLIYQIKPPCPKCPYKLGLIQTLVNPCPQCKANSYQTFERFKREVPGGYPTSPDELEKIRKLTVDSNDIDDTD